MFDFGSPEDTAQLFWAAALAVTGPKLPEVPIDEMEEEDLRKAISYCYLAYQKAEQEGASDAVLEVLVQEHDKVFQALAEASQRFRNKVQYGKIHWLGGWDPENIAKYKKLAGF